MKKTLLSAFLVFILYTGTQSQWLMQASGFPNESTGAFTISMVNKDIVWISARDGLNAPYISNEFSRTINGGETWNPGQVIPGPAHYDISNISAIDASTAWADIYLDSTAQDHHCGIYKTTNGGLNWVQQFAIQEGTTSFANNVYFWNANEGMFHGDVRDGYFEIYTTSDGGTSWNRVPQSNINATVLPPTEYGGTRFFETVGDSMFCFISSGSTLYISKDRGHHWIGKPTGIVIPPNCWYQNIAFLDENHGLIGFARSTATSMTVHETSDGGDTWTLVISTGPINLFSLEAVPGSPNTYVSTGQNASMLKSMPGLSQSIEAPEDPLLVNSGVTYSFDGGHTWQKMASTDAKHFLALQWLNDSVAFAGSWDNNATNDGMYKFTSSLAEADFTASDTVIDIGGQVTFSITSGGHSTSTFNWTFEGGSPTSSSARNPVVTYNTKGIYSATLNVINTWGNSTKIKASYINAGVGVGVAKYRKDSVSVFPNPSNGLMKISGNKPILNVRICDLTGREVLYRSVNEQQITIQTNGLKAGVYNLIIRLQNETLNRKVVIR